MMQLEMCVVCLRIRNETWIFMPCRHANCCAGCGQTLVDLGQQCPVCRSTIETRFQILINSIHIVFRTYLVLLTNTYLFLLQLHTYYYAYKYMFSYLRVYVNFPQNDSD